MIAKEKLNQLGSSMAQNIKFRDVWYFIGQKGMDGFTSMEKVSTNIIVLIIQIRHVNSLKNILSLII